MNFVRNYIALIRIVLLTFLCSCNSTEERKEVGENGLVELTVPYSKHDADYRNASKLLQDNKISEAIIVYERLCEIEVDSLQTFSYMGLATAYLMFKDYANAIDNFNKSIKLNSNNIGSYVGLGSTYYRLEDYRKAIEYYNYAKSINSKSADCYWGLALAYYELKLKDSAKINARRFIEIAPQSTYRNLVEEILSR